MFKEKVAIFKAISLQSYTKRFWNFVTVPLSTLQTFERLILAYIFNLVIINCNTKMKTKTVLQDIR